MFIPFDVITETHDRQEKPWVVRSLLVVYVVTFFLVWLGVGEEKTLDIFYRFGISRFNYQWYQAFTCTALHGEPVHLAANCIFLWLYGSKLERMLGSGPFSILYCLGAFISGNLHLLTMAGFMSDEPCIGASGAVSALLGCFFVMLPTAKLLCAFFSVISFRPVTIPAPAWIVLGMWFIGQLAYTLGIVGDVGGVAFWAHVAGFAVGAAVGSFFKFRYQQWLKAWQNQNSSVLTEAWQAVREHRPERVSPALNRVAELHPDARPLRTFMEALAAAEIQAPDAATVLLKAFVQARDYQREELKYSTYLAILRYLDPADSPPAIHLEGAFTAQRAGAYQMALAGFGHALASDRVGDERLEQMLRSIDTIFSKHLNDPVSADALRQIC